LNFLKKVHFAVLYTYVPLDLQFSGIGIGDLKSLDDKRQEKLQPKPICFWIDFATSLLSSAKI